MCKKIFHTNLYEWSYELLQILCLLPAGAVLFALVFQDTQVATWSILYSIIGDTCLILGAYFVWQSMKKGLKISSYNLAFAVFWGWALLTALLAADKYTAFYSTINRGEGFTGLLLYAGFYVCGMQLTDERRRMQILRLFSFASILICLLYVLQKSEGIRTFVGLKNNLFLLASAHDSGVFSHFNHYGYYLTLVIMCAGGLFVYAEEWSEKAWMLALFAINVAVLVANDTFGCYLAVILGLIVLTIFVAVQNKKIPYRVLLLIILFMGISLVYNLFAGSVAANFTSLFHDIGVLESSTSKTEDVGRIGTGRGVLWSRAWEYIRKSPLVGYGPDGLGVLYAADGFKQDRPANEYLQYAGYYGIPGLLLYLLGLVLLFINKVKNFVELSGSTMILGAMIAAYLVSAFFGNTAFYTTSFFFLFLGMVAGKYTY